jgi:uncharacterized protein (TIGR02266 family)
MITVMKRDKNAKRYTKRFPITFSDGQQEYFAVTSNISSTGIFIRTRKALPPGTHLHIRLEIDKGRHITLDGVVAWALKTGIADFKNGMGVRLKTIPEEYKALIRSLEH